MLEPEFQEILLKYLSQQGGRVFNDLKDLEDLSGGELLTLAQNIKDEMLPVFIGMLKSSSKGSDLFHRLMGEHEEDNRALVDSFFERYQKRILIEKYEPSHLNPLILYMPLETLTDLVFVQSREAFFCRQTAEIINEYFEEIFKEKLQFVAGEEKQAWEYFWNKVMKLSEE